MTGETATSREWRTLAVPKSQASSPTVFLVTHILSVPHHPDPGNPKRRGSDATRTHRARAGGAGGGACGGRGGAGAD